MAANVNPIFPNLIDVKSIKLENDDGTTSKVLYTGGVNGTRIDFISVTSNDTVEVVLNIYFSDGDDDFPIGQVVVPPYSGTVKTTPPVSLLELSNMPYLRDDLSYFLSNGGFLKVGANSAISVDKSVWIVATGGHY